MRGELLLYTPVLVRSNRIPPPCVSSTQDSTRKDSTQTFNIKSRDDELAHIRAREVQTHFAMQNVNANATVNAAAQTASVATPNAAQAQPAATPFAEGTVKKFAVQVKRVQLFENEDIVNVLLTFDKSFPGFTKTDDGDYVAADVNVVSLSRSALTKQLCDCDESVALLRDGQKDSLSRAQFAALLHGSTLTIARTYHVAGFVPEGRDALTRDQWFTQIEGMKMTEFAKNLVQNVIIQRMMNDDK